MASAIHRQLGQLSGSVPIDRIAHALDITNIPEDGAGWV